MREGSYHLEVLTTLKNNVGTHFSANELAAKLGVDRKRASIGGVLRELMRSHTPFVHREKISKPEMTRQFYYWYDPTVRNNCYEGQQDESIPYRVSPEMAEREEDDVQVELVSAYQLPCGIAIPVALAQTARKELNEILA